MKKITLLVSILFMGFASVQAQDEEPLTNLALNKTATASSQYRDNLGASYAFDGVATKDSRWSAANHTDATPTGENSWLQVDLGESLQFNKIIITEFSNKVTKYRIEVTDNAEDELSWEPIVADTEQTFEGISNNASRWPDITFPSITKRYVRLWIIESWDKSKKVLDEPSICEMEIYDDPSLDTGIMSTDADKLLSLNVDGEQLQIKTAQAVNSVKVIDLSGRTVIEQPFNSTISVANLSSGVYLVQLETSEGTLITRKIVKK